MSTLCLSCINYRAAVAQEVDRDGADPIQYRYRKCPIQPVKIFDPCVRSVFLMLSAKMTPQVIPVG